MKYPALIINKAALAHNVRVAGDICGAAGISFCAVVKCVCALPEITEIYYGAGVRDFADSRVQNLRKITFPDVKKWLVRIPMLCEAAEVVECGDISLNSEPETIRALSRAAAAAGKRHGVVLMIDLGDLREGVLERDAVTAAGEMLCCEHIDFLGVGTNLNCYGGIIPTEENLGRLAAIAREIETAHGVKLSVISGGNSGSVYLAEGGRMPRGINQLRLGEVILLGAETSFQRRVRDMRTDAFRLEAQIVEIKDKPSVPFGEFGLNAFGEKPVFEDRGVVRRAIAAVGRQDVCVEQLRPLDLDIGILGASSDHMILDMTRSRRNYRLGDVVAFAPAYGALLALCTSEYVSKIVE